VLACDLVGGTLLTVLYALVPLARFDLLGHLVLAAILGGLIGLERESQGKPAGLRTNILICVGAALITDLSQGLAASVEPGMRADPARLAAQIISGIGFLGAGTILQARGTVTGLTSAATLWVVAAIGIACGAKRPVEAAGTAALVLVVLLPLGFFEHKIANVRRLRRVRVEVDRDAMPVLDDVIGLSGMRVIHKHIDLDGKRLVASYDLQGDGDAGRRLAQTLLDCSEVHGFRFG